MDQKEMLEICFDDRYRALRARGISFVKKSNLDLLMKFFILMRNSIGKPSAVQSIFVDEVKNSSMIINLRNTMAHCPADSAVINFREKERAHRHVKIGWLQPVALAVYVAAAHVPIYLALPFCKWETTSRRSMRVLTHAFQSFLRRLHGRAERLYAMSDHNFYSTIACVDEHFESSVIQHGLLMDSSYYLPVLADHFMAWGERCLELSHNCPQMRVTGTYKFEKLHPLPQDTAPNVLLYCVSITDEAKVKRKIDDILAAIEGTGYILKVKLHPGSFYDASAYREYQARGIELYKECLLADIDFSTAIIENSTILLDLLYLHKRFIIFDESLDYFEPYAQLVPWAKEKGEVAHLLKNIDRISYDTIREKVLHQELNDGRCTIFEDKE